MKGDLPVWVWFRGKVLGPFLPWEVELMYSKARDILLYSNTRGWIKKEEWQISDQTQEIGRPEEPTDGKQRWFSLVYHFKRRVLGLFH